MTGIRRMGLAVAAIAAACIAAGITPSSAQSVEQFYKGKTITILLGQPPGGSYDLYARLATDYMRKFIPGSPLITVQYKPGGGGATAVAYLYASALRAPAAL